MRELRTYLLFLLAIMALVAVATLIIELSC